MCRREDKRPHDAWALNVMDQIDSSYNISCIFAEQSVQIWCRAQIKERRCRSRASRSGEHRFFPSWWLNQELCPPTLPSPFVLNTPAAQKIGVTLHVLPLLSQTSLHSLGGLHSLAGGGRMRPLSFHSRPCAVGDGDGRFARPFYGGNHRCLSRQSQHPR